MNVVLSWLHSVVKYFVSSIRKKIIIPYALLTVILAAMGVFIVTRLVATSFEERLKNQLLEAGRVVSDEVVNRERLRLEIERVVANTIGVGDALVNRDISDLEELVFPVIANARAIDSIILVDTQGKEVLRFQRENANLGGFVDTIANTNLDLSDLPAVSEVLANPDGFKQTQLAQDVESNELIIYTVGPVRDADSDVVGAALVGTYLDNEIAYLQSLALAQLTLFNEQGDVTATTFVLDNQEATETFDIFTPERYREIVNSEGVTLLDDVELPEEGDSANNLTVRGRGYRLAYAPFVLRNRIYGVYAVALPTNFITETTGQSRTLLVALFTLGALAVFGIGTLISRLISRPILRLVETAKAISAGNLDQRSGLRSDDEVGILATTFDSMTANLQHLLQVQKEEASKLNAILHSIADGVVVQDMWGDILIMNPAAREILELLGHNLDNPPAEVKEEGPQADRRLDRALLDHLTELKFRETDRFEVGRMVLSARSAPVMISEHEQLGTVVVLRDITREVESEKLKDEFITSISHELKTPLTAIKGYNSLLKMMLEMKSADEIDERQVSIVNTMDKELTDLDNLIQAMLDLSQIEAGELGVDREPLNLSELIEYEVQNWSDKMAERELQFVTNVPDTPVWVEGDHSRLTRVMHNLIKNAHDYTLPGGKVEVLLKCGNGRVQVDVKDTGVGISEEDQRFLYTRFFRAIHDENTFEVSGAGLGLYMSKAIVEAHDGEMWMQSELNRGSTFSFALPVADLEDDDVEDW